MASDATHWNERYRSTGVDAVSWYEEDPTTSLELLRSLGVEPDASVIDVGGGASTLVDHLLAAGHRDVTVLDVSDVALAAARARLGEDASVTWIVADLCDWEPSRTWDVWHDRAVLHFLVDEDDRAAYCDLLRRSLVPEGALVIGTFAEDGPTECSGLPVRRYSIDELVDLLGDVEIVERRRQVHRTPRAAAQAFNWIAGRIR
jgi:SAM-dependent methyltransferase